MHTPYNTPRIRKLILPIVMMFICFAGTIIFVVMYMAKDNNYDNTIYQYFGISPKLHVTLMYLPITRNTLLYGMNFCSLGFISCNLFFVLLFHNGFIMPRKPLLYISLFAPLLLQYILYSPHFYAAIYHGGLGFIPDTLSFRAFYGFLRSFTRILNSLYLVMSLVWIATSNEKQYPVKQLRVVKWVIFGGEVLITTLYFNLFYALPGSYVWESRVANITLYKTLDLGQYNWLVYYSPYFIALFMLVLAIALYNYQRTMREIQRSDTVFYSKVASAEISSRAFSHYIKNELISILADIEYIQGDSANRLSKLDGIDQKCHAIYDRLDNLQRHSNRITLQQSPTDLNLIILSACDSIKHSMHESDVSFNFSVTPNSAIIIFGDADYLREVFINLFVNSIEAMNKQEGAKFINVCTELMLDNRVCVNVTDNGPGFSRLVEGNMFEPFVSTKSTKLNWGIGLSFSKRIIASHNGEIVAFNIPNSGACVQLKLPVVKRGLVPKEEQ